MPGRKMVFHARKGKPTAHPTEGAGLELSREDDDLVYPISTVCSTSPSVCSFTESFGKRTLCFEVFVAALYCLALTDSGATHSFISSEYCRRHGLQCKHLRSSAALADGSSARVVGVLRRLPLKIASFRCKQTFLVLDMPGYDVVLGMDFLHAQDPVLSFRERTMRLSCSNGSHVTVPAFEEEPELPPVDIQSKTIELCSMSTFTREIRSAATDWDYDMLLSAASHRTTPCCLAKAPHILLYCHCYVNSPTFSHRKYQEACLLNAQVLMVCL